PPADSQEMLEERQQIGLMAPAPFNRRQGSRLLALEILYPRANALDERRRKGGGFVLCAFVVFFDSHFFAVESDAPILQRLPTRLDPRRLKSVKTRAIDQVEAGIDDLRQPVDLGATMQLFRTQGDDHDKRVIPVLARVSQQLDDPPNVFRPLSFHRVAEQLL